ncbi:hypothetical protein PM082_016493 [Marasmius tenuissimus]|nr:hypothetical protein PM082_016493 [Marasmius tenuissimus]
MSNPPESSLSSTPLTVNPSSRPGVKSSLPQLSSFLGPSQISKSSDIPSSSLATTSSPASTPSSLSPEAHPPLSGQEHISPSGLRHDIDSHDGAIQVSFPGYSSVTLQDRLEELHDTTTDFKKLLGRRHFCDKTPLLKVASKSPCVLITLPSGHGKTTTLSMISYFYDILHKRRV